MKNRVDLQTVLGKSGNTTTQRLSLFAFLSIGVIESLTNGLLSAADSVKLFFHAENCLFVRQQLRQATADKIMSHGVQLPDLFDVLPADDAHRQFQQELAIMRALCLKLLQNKQLVA